MRRKLRTWALGLWVIQYLYFKGVPSRDELLMYVGRIWTVPQISGAYLLNVFKNNPQYRKQNRQTESEEIICKCRINIKCI